MPQARIIIADDDDAVRDSIAEALANAGHSVVSARDGATAAEQARNGDVHLVVTDLWMPGMNGIELLARVREDHPGVNGIVVSGLATDEHVAQAVKNGAVGAFAKPFDSGDLVEAVARALLRPEIVVVARAADVQTRLATWLACMGRVHAALDVDGACALACERSIDLVVAHGCDATELSRLRALGLRTVLLAGEQPLPSSTELLARAARARAARIRA